MRRVTAVHNTFWLKGTLEKCVSRECSRHDKQIIPSCREMILQEEWEGTVGRDSKTGLANVVVSTQNQKQCKCNTYIRSWLEMQTEKRYEENEGKLKDTCRKRKLGRLMTRRRLLTWHQPQHKYRSITPAHAQPTCFTCTRSAYDQ